MSELAEVGDFCPNETCLDAGKTDKGNIVKYGTTSKGLQRYRCMDLTRVGGRFFTLLTDPN